MANTLTALAPVLFSAAQEVSNEPFGVVNSIYTDFDDKGVAKGDNVTVPVAPAATVGDFTPAAASSSGTDATAQSVQVAVTFAKKVAWHLTGEQQRSLMNGASDKEWVRQMIAQGMRALRNYAEADACTAIKTGASRAYGTAGTAPFASDLSALTNVRKILRDNGAPLTDLQCVFDTTAELNLLNLGIIQQAYQAGNDSERRTGKILRQFGFQLNASAGITTHTKGTGASATTDATGYALKSTTLTLASAGTGTLLAGDIVTFAGDSNKYVINSGDADVSGGGTITIARPGLQVAMSAATKAITVGNSYTPNMAFERSAVVGVYRPPIIPPNPTITQQTISDESGLTYLLLEIAQYGQVTWELHLAGGCKVVQPEHVALILG